VPAPESEEIDSLRLADSAADNRKRWTELPALFRYVKMPPLKPGVRKLLIERTSGNPVLTEQRIGSGRAFLLGTDETWRWRTRSGERDHDRFWLQLIRHAAGEPYGARSDRLALDVDRVAFEVGQTAQAKVRALSGVSGDALRLEVVQAGKTVSTLAPSPAGGTETGRFTARVGPLPAGDYELRLSEAGAAPSVRAGRGATFRLLARRRPDLVSKIVLIGANFHHAGLITFDQDPTSSLNAP